MPDDPSNTTPARNPIQARLVQSVQFQGPLPPPALLEAYEKICPGAALKILEAARIEGEHRREMESKVVNANVEGMRKQFGEARLGQVFAFVIAIFFVLVGAYVILRGQPWPGTILGGAGLGGIVTAFIVGRGRRNSQQENTVQPAASTNSSNAQA